MSTPLTLQEKMVLLHKRKPSREEALIVADTFYWSAIPSAHRRQLTPEERKGFYKEEKLAKRRNCA